MVAVKDKNSAGQLKMEQFQRETSGLKERCENVATRIVALMTKVEQMRELAPKKNLEVILSQAGGILMFGLHSS